VGEDV
jgi:cell division protein FtsB